MIRETVLNNWLSWCQGKSARTWPGPARRRDADTDADFQSHMGLNGGSSKWSEEVGITYLVPGTVVPVVGPLGPRA